ncbi:class I SAM-dependent DNA methyltransferase [Acetivibrio cellulolyticus]|uniref:class I SAM-dependent DNA methyltransferase n=1 Tax=Acetivibrio cellulolyticus TaxID=35830 RepID=UPI0001E2CC54|nr:class I SAM-dependent methyltransferase [Acetivibrio cellulolyticus]
MDFNQAANNWDTEQRKKRAEIVANEILQSVPVNREYSVLEFGCGTGLVSFNLYQKFRNVTLIDNSEGMIEVLNRKISEENIKNMSAFQIGIHEAFEGCLGEYDLIYSSMALHHIKDIESAIEILFKLLKKNGYLSIVDLVEEDGSFHKLETDFDGHNGFNQNVLIRVLEKVGFKNVNSHVFYKDYKIIEDSRVDYSLFIITGKKT